jgi:hypothetical protein
MGWASGSELMQKMINIAMRYIPDDIIRRGFYRGAILAFENADWDCQNDVEGIDPVFDLALRDNHPDWYDGSEE